MSLKDILNIHSYPFSSKLSTNILFGQVANVYYGFQKLLKY
jgi:hypothetical protein